MNFKTDLLNLSCEDNMELMARYPDKYFDLAIVDPPYGIGADKPSKKPDYVKQKNGNFLKVNSNKYSHKDWDKEIPNKHYFNELFRISKNQLIWGGNYFGLAGGYLIWDKLNGNSDQYGCELCWVSNSKRTDIIYMMWQGMFQGIYCGNKKDKAIIQQGNKKLNETRIHPTQKPIALYKWLLKNYAKPGDKILDTHLGSGSIAIACHYAGYELTACEIDKDYFKKAIDRIQQQTAQISLSL